LRHKHKHLKVCCKISVKTEAFLKGRELPELSWLRDSSERRRGTKMEQRKFWVSKEQRERDGERRRAQRVFIHREKVVIK